jgi:hypothetical protein
VSCGRSGVSGVGGVVTGWCALLPLLPFCTLFLSLPAPSSFSSPPSLHPSAVSSHEVGSGRLLRVAVHGLVVVVEVIYSVEGSFSYGGDLLGLGEVNWI